MMGFAWNDDENRRTIVYVVLSPENLIKMSDGNPTMIPPPEAGGIMRHVRHPENMGMVICFEPDFDSLKAMLAAGNFGVFIEHLTRNLDTTAVELFAVGVAIDTDKVSEA